MAAKKKLPTGISYKEGASLPYQVRPYDREQKKKGKLVSFATLSEAVAYKESVDAGKIRQLSRHYTADEWVTHWTSDAGFKRGKESTNLHNAERVAKFAQDFKGVPLMAIDRRRARNWALENIHHVNAVRAMMTDARLDGVISINPFERLRLPQSRGRKDIKPLTPQEITELAGISAKKWPNWPVMPAMIIVAAYTGLRRGELLALRWKDIDWENGLIRVERQWSQKIRGYDTPKNGEGRSVVLTAQAATALRTVDRNLGPDGLIWYSPRNKRIEPSLHDYYWRQIVAVFNERAGEERAAEVDLEWHALRHFTASWMVDKGIPPHDVAGQLGHTDGGKLIQTLYSHLYEDNSLKRVREGLAA